ncbi:ABC transporter permease subunit [Paraflavitalea sp. CAU 1676]|uniref:ABC transporter permease subunit n=1 Tax=Paraflavitalea sp. CAU 1676 TaxID=3032598 RepID=UPI0023DAE48F|nr:ABC transporter permease subunit [Paraflavitalea sp. CAU 1676]MDF2192516.1 ABC transporter permease subunit [Paraflavitalea sp. CAU 1676]
MFKLAKYVWYDILRSKVVIAYTAFLLTVSMSLFQLEADSGKALLSLLNIILLIVPLVSIIFATIHYYNSYEFIELMLSQPVSRTRILLSEYVGTAGSLTAAFLLGVGIPVLIYQPTATGMALLFTGSMLTIITCSLAFLVSVKAREKARGIGAALLCWFYFALLYDGLLLLLIFTFSDYPLEKVTLLLTSLNPIDLARIFLMLQLDISALMGYTGATYKVFFGSGWGLLYTAVILLAWAMIPLWMAIRRFRRKDL